MSPDQPGRRDGEGPPDLGPAETDAPALEDLVEQGDLDESELERPNAARMYDWYLGGATNTAADRELGAQMVAERPELPAIAAANRTFLGRAVRFCLAQGVHQFLDLGSGTPTVGNVHQVAHRIDPSARVVYVDRDAVTATLARDLVSDEATVGVVQADLRDPAAVLDAPATRTLLDWRQPVAVLAVAVLHFLPDADDPAGLLAAYRAATAPGSYQVLSHGTADHQPPGAVTATNLYRHTDTPLTLRSYDQVLDFFAGTDLVAPGVVFTPAWRPTKPEPFRDRPHRAGFWAGVARIG